MTIVWLLVVSLFFLSLWVLADRFREEGEHLNTLIDEFKTDRGE